MLAVFGETVAFEVGEIGQCFAERLRH
jgi:hypothetical protein